MENVQLDRIFTDHASGKDANRPALRSLLDFVREGDTVIVHSLDRLACNLDDLRRPVKGMTVQKIRVEFIKENLIFTGEDSPMANLLLSMMGAFAEFERTLIRERQRKGIALAKNAAPVAAAKKPCPGSERRSLQTGSSRVKKKPRWPGSMESVAKPFIST